MNIDQAYHLLFMGALIIFAVLIGVMLIRAVIGPRITDRILSINMIGTMTICSIAILSGLLKEGYLTDVALIYAMLSFVSVLILAVMYIPAKPEREKLKAKQGKGKQDQTEQIGEEKPDRQTQPQTTGLNKQDRQNRPQQTRAKKQKTRKKGKKG